MEEADKKFMQRAIALADLGKYSAAPNPRVGAVIVHDGKIIGEGFHHAFGEAHAEVNAIHSVKNPDLLKKSTLYVNLEPCSHYGKTPPCSELIIKHQIPRLLIANSDPFKRVNGKGVKQLRSHGVEVITKVLEQEGQALNRRFFTFHQKQRPYIILKFAKSKDGYIARKPGDEHLGKWITGDLSKQLVHLWRAEEQAILIGKNTAKIDNPQLNCREVAGKSPLRLVIDSQLELPKSLTIFNDAQPTLLINQKIEKRQQNTRFLKRPLGEKLPESIISICKEENLLSIIVEGGATILKQFIKADLWDEARILSGELLFHSGIKAPEIEGELIRQEKVESDLIQYYRNPRA